MLTRTADKLGVRSYITELIGDENLTDLYAVLDDPTQLMGVELPDRYVVKPTHSTDRVALVESDSPARRAEVVAQAQNWLVSRHWLRTGEWAYRGVPPRLMVEEFLDVRDGFVPPDWRFWCFGGRVELVQADFDRFREVVRNFYTRDGARVALRVRHPAGPDVPVPATFLDMRRIAERLSAEFDFVRVDMFSVDDRIVVGELTHYPGAGAQSFDPPEWDEKLGGIWERVAQARETSWEHTSRRSSK